ncbi:MAG: septum formation initiator family protein [Myxococcota bacterium]
MERSVSWLIPFGLLAMAIVSVPTLMLDDQGLPRYEALGGELREVRQVNERLRREVRALHREVQSLRTDPAEVERIARDELGMLREGELIFQFSSERNSRPH